MQVANTVGLSLTIIVSIIYKLEGYVFPEEGRSMVECLSAYVADVAMEEVMELAESLIHKLQQEA